MTSRWLTLPEFLAASGIPRSTFFAKRESFTTRKQGRTLLIASSSLPAAARAKLHLIDSLSSPRKELQPPSSTAAPALFAGAGAQSQSRRILLRPEQERLALGRLAILQPLLDFCADPAARARLRLLQLQDGTPVRTADDLAEFLAQTHSTEGQPVTRPTLWRWKKRYEEQGLTGLARKLRQDKGRAKWAERWPEAAQLAAAAFTSPSQSRQQAYDALVLNLPRLGMAQADLPSYAAVCDFLNNLPAPAVVLGRLGERAHNERMAPYLRRKYTDMAANEVWVSDSMIHDMLVRDDCFNQDNAAVRLQLTAIMDMRSRKMVGYTWVLNGSSRSITTALIRAVKAHGPCRAFYCDNGKDFQKVGRFARPANYNAEVDEAMQSVERTGALRQLGIDVTFCIKYRPQSKPIERFFRTLHARLDSAFRHYTGGNAYQRPDAAVAAAATHGKLLRMERPDISPLIPASQFVAMAATWIEQDYNAKHKHSGVGMEGRTPDEVFAEGYARRDFDLAILDTLLWRRERRKVRECSVTVDGRRLIGDSTFASELLYRANETEVIVCFDPNAPLTGVVTNLDGVKICDVRAETFVPQSAEAGPMIAASLQLSRGLRNNTAESLRRLRKTVAARGYVTAQQDLHERALLPMAVGDHITQRVAPEPKHRPAAPRYAHEIALAAMEDE